MSGLDKVVLFAAAILCLLPLSVAFGMLAGWIVGLLFDDVILGTLARFGVHGVSMAQLGATLGFVSAFLRTKVST